MPPTHPQGRQICKEIPNSEFRIPNSELKELSLPSRAATFFPPPEVW
jgi:hypothetical protein